LVVRCPGRDLDHQVVCRVVFDVDRVPAQPKEDDRRQPTEALVPIHERATAHQGFQQDGALLIEARVGIAPVEAAPGSGGRRVHQPKIVHRTHAEITDEREQILQCEELGH